MKKNMEKTDLTERNPLFWDFPGGPVLQTRCCHYRVIRSIPGQGPAISHTPWHWKKKNTHTEKRLVHGLSWHYFYFLFITFNLRKYWSIVDLQCVSFRCTVESFSYTHIEPRLSDNLMLIGYWRILSRSPAAAEGGPWWLSAHID